MGKRRSAKPLTRATGGKRSGSRKNTPEGESQPLTNAGQNLGALLEYLASGLAHKDAAKLTGYTPGSVRTLAHRHKAQIAELAIGRFQTELPQMIEALRDMATSKDTPANTKLAGIRDWLDRALGKSVERRLSVSATVRGLSDEELDAKLLEYCGGDRARLELLLQAVGGEQDYGKNYTEAVN